MSSGTSPKFGIWAPAGNGYGVELKQKAFYPWPLLGLSPALRSSAAAAKASVAHTLCTAWIPHRDQDPQVPGVLVAGSSQLSSSLEIALSPRKPPHLRLSPLPWGQPTSSTQSVQDTEPAPLPPGTTLKGSPGPKLPHRSDLSHCGDCLHPA